jgi:hypothetical protein
MANLIDYSQIETKVKKYKDIYECRQESEAFEYVVLEQVLNLPSDEIKDCITDGPNDKGIDAIYVDDLINPPVIHFFQFKYIMSFDNVNRRFPVDAVNSVLTFVQNLLSKNFTQSDCNALLWRKIEAIWELFLNGSPAPRFVVHLCSNGLGLSPNELDLLKRGLEQYRYFEVKEHTLSSIAALIIDNKKPNIDRHIKLVDNQFFERVDGNIRGLIATVQAKEIVELIKNPASSNDVLLDIFNDNVRIYLTNKNPINQKIISSALSTSNREFWYLNNGITITCDSFDFTPMRAPTVNMIGLSLSKLVVEQQYAAHEAQDASNGSTTR